MDVPAHPSERLVLDRVTFAYPRGADVLSDVSLRFSGPGLVSLVAGNGVGKSTLVELVSGYLRPGSGRVVVAGQDADAPRARADRRIVRTRTALYPTMSVYDHLVLASDIAGADRGEALARARRYRLDDWLDTRSNQLSAGTERKVWLLMCTLGRFGLAVLDEPFTGLDDQARHALLEDLDAWREAGALVVVATHEHPDGYRPDAVVRFTGRGPQVVDGVAAGALR